MHRLILLMALLGIGHFSWGWDYNHDYENSDEASFEGDAEDWHEHYHEDLSTSDDRGGPNEGGSYGYHDWHGRHGWHGPHGWHGGRRGQRGIPDEHNFNKLSRYIMKADRYAKRLCNNNNLIVEEQYGDQSYRLLYTLPSSHVDNITVKIQHRAIYMRAQQSTVIYPQTFADVRILPNTLNTANAFWQYKDDHITVNIPYKMTFGTTTRTECVNVNETVLAVENAPAIILYH